MDISKEQLEALLTVTQVAELHGIPARVVRKAAKANEVPGQVTVLGKYGFDPEQAMDWVPPEPGARVVGARREDGRRRYRIYLNQEEATKLLAEGYEITDPAVAAKARRAARKAGEAQGSKQEGEGAEGEDIFADFGA